MNELTIFPQPSLKKRLENNEIPVLHRQILFHSNHQPLVDYLKKKKTDEYAFLVSQKVNSRLIEEKIWQNERIFTNIQDGKMFQPDFCLSPGNYVDFRLPGIKVEIFHGIGIEKNPLSIRHF